MKKHYQQCPNCGQHKLEKHGKKWALLMFGGIGGITSLITLGIGFIILIPLLILILIFKKENYRCRNCQVVIPEKEYLEISN
jgi:RNA polymerase subunit RPABC4/transcription elongation factor Spt4